MKAWIAPVLEELEIKKTTAPVDISNMTSGQVDQLDLGTCSNQYWAGNGLTKEEAIKENPHWGGSWGN